MQVYTRRGGSLAATSFDLNLHLFFPPKQLEANISVLPLEKRLPVIVVVILQINTIEHKLIAFKALNSETIKVVPLSEGYSRLIEGLSLWGDYDFLTGGNIVVP